MALLNNSPYSVNARLVVTNDGAAALAPKIRHGGLAERPSVGHDHAGRVNQARGR